MKKIGLNICFCIADIVEGNVDIDDVSKIITGMKCKDEKEWNKIISLYRKAFWSSFPNEAEKILRQLISENRVEQPRLRNERYPIADNEHWVDSEDEINWTRDAV